MSFSIQPQTSILNEFQTTTTDKKVQFNRAENKIWCKQQQQQQK